MKTEHSQIEALDRNFAGIRGAIETHSYADLDRLLAEQRTLIGNLPFADPDAQAYFTQAQDLVAWSLSMVRLRQSVISMAISDAGRQKLIHESYGRADVPAHTERPVCK
jgi:hypothetical protein